MGLQHGDVHQTVSSDPSPNGLARECGQTTPAIDFDCSNVAFKVGKNAVWLAQFLVRWARLGLRLDGHTDSSADDCADSSK